MTLPTPSMISWTDWSKYYKIDTPTFHLSPIEKPNMSPFLIHMTGKNAILSILKGENAITPVSIGQGYLQANVPEYSESTFDAKVVCFSESPTFALDFFRYRKIDRWKADQRFGIGFDKAGLVETGVRPVIYVEEKITKHLIYLYNRIKNNGLTLSNNSKLNKRLIDEIETLYPLLYPLMENHSSQGFMWEREWRYPNPEGMVFRHQDIKIICCPIREENEIRKILGQTANQIDFIRTWQEYDDVTDYLRRQQATWRSHAIQVPETTIAKRDTQHLQNMIQQYSIALNSLDSYHDLLAHFSNEMERVTEEREKLKAEIAALQAELDKVQDKKPE